MLLCTCGCADEKPTFLTERSSGWSCTGLRLGSCYATILIMTIADHHRHHRIIMLMLLDIMMLYSLGFKCKIPKEGGGGRIDFMTKRETMLSSKSKRKYFCLNIATCQSWTFTLTEKKNSMICCYTDVLKAACCTFQGDLDIIYTD